jgi:hypothetical protein
MFSIFRNYIYLLSFIFLIIKNMMRLSLKKDFIQIIYGSIIGYYYSGLLSGFFHWFLDSYNFKLLKYLHTGFRNHHWNPLSMEKYTDFDHITQLIPATLPIFMILHFIKNKIIISMNIIGLPLFVLCQIIHKWSHRRKHENDKDSNGNYLYRVPKLIKKLQNIGIILNPILHSEHHKTELVNFGITHSNSDKLFEYIIFELLGLPSAIYSNSNGVHKLLNKYQRRNIIGTVYFYDVVKEQKLLIIITLFYILNQFYYNI